MSGRKPCTRKNQVTKTVEVFTDGACRGNPGKGGWGVLLRYGEVEKILHGGDYLTTNNKMELTAVIRGLAALSKSSPVKITTDSKYVLQGMTEWLPNWKRRNWKTASKKPVKNVDLWRELDELVGAHDIEWQWVKGHSGHRENDIADQLANQGIDELS
ncbi:MAG: ribonuclease HI [Gammaproteobacteria bacterium]|nr:ribonuclease HI [Gammaproteobacteria bacterium]